MFKMLVSVSLFDTSAEILSAGDIPSQGNEYK